MTGGPSGLVPARLAFDANGVPRSEVYGDVYHSDAGAPGQARHVFLAGNDLPGRWHGRRVFTVLETGFGAGLNFLCTWQAHASAGSAAPRLSYVAVERHPFARDDLARLLGRYPELEPLASRLVEAWPPLVAGFHRLHFDGGRVSLTLLLGDAGAMLGELEAAVDAIYLDGFAPDRNPEMWSDAVFRELGRLAVAGASAASWTVAASVRRGLETAGFDVGRRPGYARKREMLVATRRADGAPQPGVPSDRRVLVVGAGIAGSCCAERLAARGWSVEVLDRREGIALEASGNPAGVVRPLLNLSDTRNARLSRSAYLYAVRCYGALGLADVTRGMVHVAPAGRSEERLAAVLARGGYDPAFVRWVDRSAASALAGQPAAGAGWWFPDALTLEPRRACAALLSRSAIGFRPGRAVAGIVAGEAGVQVSLLGESGSAAHPVVVHAGGVDELPGGQLLPLQAVRGQVTVIPPNGRMLAATVCGDGYVAPLPGGGLIVGATFQRDDPDPHVRTADHAENLARLQSLTPGLVADADASGLAGRVGFRAATPDRLPICGRLGASGTLLTATGLGARGLTWAPLLAELLASILEGEPLPLERSLVAAIDPARFLRRSG